MKKPLLFITLIITGCSSSNYSPVATLYFRLEDRDIPKLQSVIGEFAKANELHPKGTDNYTIAYYEKMDEEDVEFIVFDMSDRECNMAAFNAHKTKLAPMGASIRPALLEKLKLNYSGGIHFFNDEYCRETL